MADNASSSADLDISDLDDSAFDNNSRWPRRLLHLPTWTSYKWQPGNIYGGHLEPKYVALSYTWGRWQLPEAAKPQTEALPIQGVPWTIPRVDPDLHFALADFINVLYEVVQDPLRRYYYYAWRGVRINSREGWGGAVTSLIRWLHKLVSPPYQFIWLDIACINQRYNKITLAEIGRQAHIFQHAEHVYVWLSRTSHERLESLLDGLQTGVGALETEPYMKSQKIEQISRTEGLLDQILRGLKGLLEDPWFTSLWTLQEAYLCPKAIMLSRDGCPVSDRGVTLVAPRSQTLNNVFSHANNLAFWSTRTQYARTLPQYQPVIELIRKAGLAVLWMNNPMALLGVSHSRKVTRELDYVYGIMQIFDSDFRVGNTRFEGDQNHEYTLAELEDEFGAAIVDKFPILSQMYVYLETPAFGKGWCVQTTSTVPEVLDRGDMFGWTHGASNRLAIDCRIESFTLCSLTTRVVGDTRWAYLSGKACEFSSLQQEWRKADNSNFAKAKQRSYWRMHRRSQPTIMMISLDKGYRQEDILGEEDKPVILAGEVEEREHKLAEWITEQFQSLSPKVFLLGRSEFGDEAFHTGLILFEREDRGIKHWHRIGVCTWLTSHLTSAEGRYPGLPLMIGESEGWKHIEGLMG